MNQPGGTASSPLPAQVQAALHRGDRVEAIRLLKASLQTHPERMPDVAAALARGDSAQAAALLRAAVERAIGPPPADSSPRNPAAADSLAPGQVPRSGTAAWASWVVLLLLALGVVWWWMTR